MQNQLVLLETDGPDDKHSGFQWTWSYFAQIDLIVSY